MREGDSEARMRMSKDFLGNQCLLETLRKGEGNMGYVICDDERKMVMKRSVMLVSRVW